MAVPLSDLNLDPANARKHDQRNLEAIAASLTKLGQHRPAVVQKQGMVVRVGNGMVEAARNLGWTHVAAIVVDENDVEATARAIADNQIGTLASWDDDILGRQLQALQIEGFDLAITGFDLKEFQPLIDAAVFDQEFGGGEVVNPEDQIQPLADAVSQTGDLWVLGPHRLLVDDSSVAANLDRLLSGAEIDIVNTDPPYNVKVEPRSNNAIAAGLSSFAKPETHHQSFDLHRHPEKSRPTENRLRAKDRPLANDFVSDEEFDRLLDAWFGNMARVLKPGRAFYIWGGYANLGNYPPYLKKHGMYFSQGIVWDKEHPVLTRKDFMGAFEICFYGWREGAAHRYFGPNNATDLWHVKKVNPQSMIHLTEKPVELARRAMEYSSKKGENVLDLFGGSGSTLMGAEIAGRHAYLMEIDFPYADVIVRRWQKATGHEATLEATGRTWAQTAEDRGVNVAEEATGAQTATVAGAKPAEGHG
jgi:DNA modification methylase